MDKDLLAQYGEACINAEIWNNRMMELKRKLAQEINKAEKKDAVVEAVPA